MKRTVGEKKEMFLFVNTRIINLSRQIYNKWLFIVPIKLELLTLSTNQGNYLKKLEI